MNNRHATEFSQWDVAKLQTVGDQAADPSKPNSDASNKPSIKQALSDSGQTKLRQLSFGKNE